MTDFPPNMYSPKVALSSSPIMLRSVVLPQPLGPMIMMNSPRRTVRSKFLRA